MRKMNKETIAQGGERNINKPESRFEVLEIDRYDHKALLAKIQDIERKKEFHVDAYFDGDVWKAKTGMEEYSPSDIEIIEQIIQNAMNNKTITECNKLGLELMEADFIWNIFLFGKREEVNNLESAIKAKIVNTGINRYIEFEEHLQGFKNGEILEYQTCQDGTAVIIRKYVSGGNNGKKR